MNNTIRPIFIFSLPRSGSTLLQRIIASQPNISTTSEPWLLLPLFYSLKTEGAYSEYNHHTMHDALQDFILSLPNKEQDFHEAVSIFAVNLYAKSARPNDIYFVDKTPRYHLIAHHIIRAFPDAKIIFLWRNPLSIIASSLSTFGKGKWRLYDYKIDLFKGFENLHNVFTTMNHQGLSINYEDLITNPATECEKLFNHLNLDFNTDLLNNFTDVYFQGGAGDPTGIKTYKEISHEPLHKWKKTLSNPIRKKWSKEYIDWVGDQRLADIGYEYNKMRAELASIKSSMKYVPSDILRITYGILLNTLHTNIIWKKLRCITDLRKLYSLK